MGGQFDVQESADGANWTTIYSMTSKATTVTNFNDPIITRSLNQASRWVRFYFTSKLPGGNASVPGGNMAVDLVTITAARPLFAACCEAKQHHAGNRQYLCFGKCGQNGIYHSEQRNGH